MFVSPILESTHYCSEYSGHNFSLLLNGKGGKAECWQASYYFFIIILLLFDLLYFHYTHTFTEKPDTTVLKFHIWMMDY